MRRYSTHETDRPMTTQDRLREARQLARDLDAKLREISMTCASQQVEDLADGARAATKAARALLRAADLHLETDR